MLLPNYTIHMVWVTGSWICTCERAWMSIFISTLCLPEYFASATTTAYNTMLANVLMQCILYACETNEVYKLFKCWRYRNAWKGVPRSIRLYTEVTTLFQSTWTRTEDPAQKWQWTSLLITSQASLSQVLGLIWPEAGSARALNMWEYCTGGLNALYRNK